MRFPQLTQMQFPIVNTSQAPNWRWPDQVTLPAHADLQEWLLDPQSLTAKLKTYCQEFVVEVLGQAPGIIRDDEARWLATNGSSNTATIREVILCCDGKPWVFARSVFPQAALNAKQLKLSELGNQPLGAHLFAQPDLQRSAIEICEFAADSRVGELHQKLGYPAQSLWGRRSCFTAGGQKVLVAEVFIGDAIPAQAHSK